MCSTDAFWSNLTPETALLARTFVEHCISTNDQGRLEATMPVVTALAFHIQSQFNVYLVLSQEAEDVIAKIEESGGAKDEDTEEQMEQREERMAGAVFIVGELLQLATHMDYSDEIGRRKMFGIVSKCAWFCLDELGLVRQG
jgi:condensin complex subunit 3